MFRCKQFTIKQDKCAMKVNTDSLILGSWLGQSLGPSIRALDIGTGTGILALMLAQQSDNQSMIDAVEIDACAAAQAQDNCASSMWAHKLRVHLTQVQTYSPSSKYDLIVTNPPYFSQVSAPTKAFNKQTCARKTARQSGELTAHTLFLLASKWLTDAGSLFCLYPHAGFKEKMAIAEESGLVCSRLLHVQHNASSTPYVTAFEFVKLNVAGGKQASLQRLIIREPNNDYTETFKALCRDFYLRF